MTKAAKSFSKHLYNFWDAADTKVYVEELRKHPEIQGFNPIEASPGRYGGTWAHPKLAVFFARWLDVRFAVWCDAMIDDILKGHAQVTITKPQESAVMALPQDYEGALSELTGIGHGARLNPAYPLGAPLVAS